MYSKNKHFKLSHLIIPIALFTLTFWVAGCSDNITNLPGGGTQNPAPPGTQSSVHFAPIQVTITGIGTQHMSASARSVRSKPVVASAAPEVQQSVGSLTPLDTIQLKPVSQGTFSYGSRSDGGQRYISATFKVRNNTGSPLNNLTFMAVRTDTTIGQSPVVTLALFNGDPVPAATADSIAKYTIPTGSATLTSQYTIKSPFPDVLQVYTPDEAAAVDVSGTSVTHVLPYGFVTRTPHVTPDSRTLPANPGPNEYDGVVTFAFKVPLQASLHQDPYTIIIDFLPVQDSQTRITQSLQEQTAAGREAFVQRAEELGASMTLLGESIVRPRGSGTRTLGGINANGLENFAPLLTTRNVVSAGTHGAMAIKADGSLIAWGYGGSSGDPWGASDIPAGLTNVIAVHAGYFATRVIKEDGTIVEWGRNDAGQLDTPAGLSNVVAISGGVEHTLALKANGTVVAWGSDAQGQLDVPAGLSNVIAITAGSSYYSLALRANGTVVGWGAFAYVDTSATPDSVDFRPITVPAELQDPVTAHVVAITGGQSHAVALKANGTVVAWGQNENHQLEVPAELSNVIAIDAIFRHTVALKADGTVVAWGFNDYGQIDVPAALQNPSTAHVVAVAAGNGFSFALKADGSVVEWGEYPPPGGPIGVKNVPPGPYRVDTTSRPGFTF